MPFELRRRRHLERELVKRARRELRDASRALGKTDGSAFDEAVHASRKGLKKVRAVATLLAESGTKVPRKERRRWKTAARALSRIRDSAAIVQTFDAVRGRHPDELPEHTLQILRQALVVTRNREQARARREGIIAKTGRRLAKSRNATTHWHPRAMDVADLLAVVAGSYRRSRRAMKRARTTGQSATFHEWRKTVKTFWYQLRLANKLFTGLGPLIADLDRLETDLGEDHNLVVMEATLRGCRELRSMRPAIRQFGRLAAEMRQDLRQRAFEVGGRAYARKPKAFARWLRKAAKRTAPRAAAA